jgi:hypothetical protein
MADVFISYAKPDRPLASKLAAMLEAEGWTTWWDTSLTIGDDFRNEIGEWRRRQQKICPTLMSALGGKAEIVRSIRALPVLTLAA